ncbi:hypothetical protein AAHE18_01G039800 [Arachis hypogaea]
MDTASGSEGGGRGEERGEPEPPSPVPVAAAPTITTTTATPAETSSPPAAPSRYESQKRRDWNTFLQYLRNHKPPLTLARCSGAHVIEFLKYLDQFGKTKVHVPGCPYFGHPNPPAPCACPLKQAWGRPESNPFGAKAVRIYLREVREGQAKARGIPYEKKKRKRSTVTVSAVSSSSGSGAISIASGSGGGGDGNNGGGETPACGGGAGGSSASTLTSTANGNATTVGE